MTSEAARDLRAHFDRLDNEQRFMLLVSAAAEARDYKAALERIRDSEAPAEAPSGYLKAIAASALGDGPDPDGVRVLLTPNQS